MGLADDLDLYIDTIVAGHSVPVDLGRVGSEYFINVASAGMLTSVAHEVDVRLKNAFGKMAYYLRGIGELPRFRALKLQIEADGEVFEERAFLFVVVNSSIVGSLKNVAVDAKVNDGKLDMVLLQHCSLPELMTVIAQKIKDGIGSSEVFTIHDLAYEQLLNIAGFAAGEYFVYCICTDAPILTMTSCSPSAAFKVAVR